MVFALLGILIYANTLDVPFIFDDTQNIRDNPHIRLETLTWKGLVDVGFESYAKARPVANLSFALNHYLHGYALKGYHVINIAIHLFNAWLLFVFINLTLRSRSIRLGRNDAFWIAFLAALLWLVHPVQTQSVTYIVQRMNSLAVMFYLVCLVAYIKARTHAVPFGRYTLFGVSLVSGILAIGSKEIAITLPFFIFLYEWYFFQDLDRAWMRRYVGAIALIIILLIALVFMFTGGHPVERILSDYGHRDFTLGQRVLTQFRVVVYYLTLLVFPHPSRLSLDYDFPLSNSLIDPVTTLLCLVLIFSLIVISVLATPKQRLLSFCIIWFFGNLALESSVMALEIVYEHRIYLPSMMICLGVVWLYYRHIPHKKTGVVILTAVIAVFCVWTYQRNAIWRDEVALWQNNVDRFPDKARTRNNLGIALAERGRIKEAKPHFERALKLEPTYAQAHFNLANVLRTENDLEGAIGHYQTALRVKKKYPEAHYQIGHAYLASGKTDRGVSHLKRAVAINPNFTHAYYDLGRIMQESDKPEEAIDYFLKTLEIDPQYLDALYHMGNLLRRQGRDQEAIVYYQRALEIKYESAALHNNLAISLYKAGKKSECIAHFKEALRIDPDYAGARDNLNKILFMQNSISNNQ